MAAILSPVGIVIAIVLSAAQSLWIAAAAVALASRTAASVAVGDRSALR